MRLAAALCLAVTLCSPARCQDEAPADAPPPAPAAPSHGRHRAGGKDPLSGTVAPFDAALKQVQGLDVANPGAILKSVNAVLQMFTGAIGGAGGDPTKLEGLADSAPLVKLALASGIATLQSLPQQTLEALTQGGGAGPAGALDPSNAGAMLSQAAQLPGQALQAASAVAGSGPSGLLGPTQLVTGFNGALDNLRQQMTSACSSGGAPFCAPAGADQLCAAATSVSQLHPPLVDQFPDILKGLPLLHCSAGGKGAAQGAKEPS